MESLIDIRSISLNSAERVTSPLEDAGSRPVGSVEEGHGQAPQDEGSTTPPVDSPSPAAASWPGKGEPTGPDADGPIKLSRLQEHQRDVLLAKYEPRAKRWLVPMFHEPVGRQFLLNKDGSHANGPLYARGVRAVLKAEAQSASLERLRQRLGTLERAAAQKSENAYWLAIRDGQAYVRATIEEEEARR